MPSWLLLEKKHKKMNDSEFDAPVCQKWDWKDELYAYPSAH